MSRLEYFQQIIERAKADANKARLAGLPIEQWWEEIREQVIRPVLADAVTVLKINGFSAEQNLMNSGSGIGLKASSDVFTTHCNITFTLSGQVIHISCTRSVLDDDWVRAHVTEEEATRKIGQFIELFVNPDGSAPASRASELQL